jgi:transcriptional regulator NrdR family protein
MVSKWAGLACPDCGCKKMVACDSRRIAGGMLRVRQCSNPDCLRRVHTIETIRANKSESVKKRRVRLPGSPSRPG